MDTNAFWLVRGTYEQRKAKLAGLSKAHLEAVVLDSEYNEFLRDRADYGESEKHERPVNKRIPYIGWFWRHLEFHAGTLPIGDCGGFIGFMANNKWEYPQRDLTTGEFIAVMAVIDEAMRLNEEGGDLRDIVGSTNAKLEELWPLLQTFKVPAR